MANLQYIGARYVPKFYLNPDDNSNDWKSGEMYEALTIVTYNNDSYTSKVPVPSSVGNPADNPQYWACTTKYTAALLALQTTVGDHETRIDALELNSSVYVTPEDYGAVGDGVTDDSLAIQDAIDSGKIVVFANAQYKVANTIIVPNNTTVYMNSAVVIADTGVNPVFRVPVDGEYGRSRIAFHGVDAIIRGEASSVFEFNGTNHFEHSPSNYARDISIDHIHGASNNIDNFISMNVAVRDTFITKCSSYCKNGIVSNGKCVEIMVDSCLLYINTTGNPISLESNLGGQWYNEGWSFTNCTIDGPDGATVYIADVYSCQFSNCYIGAHIKIDKPTTTTHTREVILSGNVISSNIEFQSAGDATGNAFFAVLASNSIQGKLLVNRGGHIEIIGNNFETYPDTPSTYAIALRDNVNDIVISENVIDDSFAGGIIDQGANITNCSIHDNTYSGSGYGVSLAGSVEVHGNVGGSSNTDIIAQIPSGTYAVGSDLLSVPIKLGNGQKGMICARLVFSAPADSNEQIVVACPTDMSVPQGTGWASHIVRCGGETYVDICIPYWAKADVDGNFKLVNYAGDSVTVTTHSWLDITR